MPITSERQLWDYLKTVCSKNTHITLQLWPDQMKSIAKGPFNKCKVKQHDITIQEFPNITETFYDLMVKKYHNKPKTIKS